MDVIRLNRGKEFEDLIFNLLSCLKKQNPGNIDTTPGAVEVICHPRIKLYNSEILISDYELISRTHHSVDHHLIECQDRKRSSQDIVHKIRHMKSLSSRNRFIFVYKDKGYLSDAIKNSLKSDGIISFDLDGFVIFLIKLNYSMASNAGRTIKGNNEFSNFKKELKLIVQTDSLNNNEDEINKKEPVIDSAPLVNANGIIDLVQVKFNFPRKS